MKKTLIYALIIISIFACKQDDECPNGTLLEKDILSQEALHFNPYSTTNKKAIFKDQMGIEYDFGIERNEVSTTLNQISSFCYEGEFLKLYLRGLDLGVHFHIWINDVLKPNPENASGEEFYIGYGETEDTDATISIDEFCLVHSINIKDASGMDLYTNRTVTTDSMIINGTTFYDVIQNNDSAINSLYEVFYNLEMGLVGFKDIVNNRMYHLDRIED